MNDVTKDLLDALLNVARMAENLKKPCGTDPESPQAIRNAQYMNISYAARAAIARAEAALAEPKAHHQEPMTIRLDPNAPCRNALAREGKPYPKSNCQRCGTLMRPGWKCAEGVELGKPPMRGCELRDDAVGVFKP